MDKDLKNALDTARATYDLLKQQHATAGAKKDAIIARRPALHQALNSAAERLEAAQLGNMRGVVADSVVAAARGEHQAARDALVRQNEDEELAARALNMADEFQKATEALGRARTEYFGEIAEHIEKTLRGDTKLRSRLISAFSANLSMSGRAPEEYEICNRLGWMEFLVERFPVPTNEEGQRGFSEFIKTYDPA